VIVWSSGRNRGFFHPPDQFPNGVRVRLFDLIPGPCTEYCAGSMLDRSISAPAEQARDCPPAEMMIGEYDRNFIPILYLAYPVVFATRLADRPARVRALF